MLVCNRLDFELSVSDWMTFRNMHLFGTDFDFQTIRPVSDSDLALEFWGTPTNAYKTFWYYDEPKVRIYFDNDGKEPVGVITDLSRLYPEFTFDHLCLMDTEAYQTIYQAGNRISRERKPMDRPIAELRKKAGDYSGISGWCVWWYRAKFMTYQGA